MFLLSGLTFFHFSLLYNQEVKEIEYKGRYWTKGNYGRGDEYGPKEFTVEADSPEEALEKANNLMVRKEVMLSRSLISRNELFIDGQWKGFGLLKDLYSPKK